MVLWVQAAPVTLPACLPCVPCSLANRASHLLGLRPLQLFPTAQTFWGRSVRIWPPRLTLAWGRWVEVEEAGTFSHRAERGLLSPALLLFGLQEGRPVCGPASLGVPCLATAL